MAGDSDTGEKTEEATPERLRKLREEGNVAKSQDVTAALKFMGVFVILVGMLPFIFKELRALFNEALLLMGSNDTPSNIVAGIVASGWWTMMKVVLPILGAELVLALALNLAQVGFMFTIKPILPDPKKLNPVQGLKNIFNKKKLVELLKTLVKFVIVSWVSYVALRDALRDVVLIVRSDLLVGMKVTGGIIWDFCIKIGSAFIVIAAFDAVYQKKKYLKDNMMSKYDVKQEYKQQEGDPQHKAERRRFHQEILQSASPAAVKGADVVVRNPDHIAVALRYDKSKEGAAPELVAKGERIWAEKIIEAAQEHGVPIVRNIPLAQALNKLDVGDEIPEELYEAVAEVLNFVYTLSEQQKGKRTLPPKGTPKP